MSKFSVRKPFTVLVGIVMVLVLGIVSATRMTTDLLPEMNLPYAIVITTYPGATPEEVEASITRPIEASMATVSNIEHISSTSSENVSMVVLEFSQDTSMDSVSLEMRENLDQMESAFPDAAGSPIIMKLNPSMMPVMITAVSKDKTDRTTLSEYVDSELSQQLESVEGVASVTVTGGSEESVQVILDKEKIQKVNAKIYSALNGQFAEGYEKLEQAKKELADGRSQAQSGQDALQSAKSSTLEQLKNGELQIRTGQRELLQNEKDLEQAIADYPSTEEETLRQIEEKRQAALAEISIQEESLLEKEQELILTQQELAKQETALVAQQKQLQEQQAQLNEQQAQLAQQKTAWSSGKALLSGQLLPAVEQIEANPALSEAEKAQALSGLLLTLPEEWRGLFADGLSADGIRTQIAETDRQITEGEAALAQAQTQLASGLKQIEEGLSKLTEAKEPLTLGMAQLTAAKQQLATAKEQVQSSFDAAKEQANKALADGKAQMLAAKEQIATGKVSLDEALAELNKNANLASIEISTNSSTLERALAGLEEGQSQLDSSLEQLDESKEDALAAADLTDRLTAATIEQLLVAQNFSMPAGYIVEDGVSYLVRVGEKKEVLSDLEEMVLLDLHMDDLDPIRLKDVADVSFGNVSEEVYAKVNGSEGIMISIQKQTGYSTGEVSDRVLDKLESIQKQEDGIHFTTLMDQGIYIDMVVDSVLENMIVGGIMAVLILLLFLRDLRPTLVVAVSIPVSVVAAIVLMYFSGVTLNIISLSGLALGIGMLVDNSIVVIENIYRLRGQGHSPRDSAVAGCKQVTGAIIASTLTTVCVYLPIVFMEGITRQLFVDMGLTIAYSLLASLVIAMTLVPAMSAGVLKNVHAKEHKWLDRVQNAYARLLGTLLNKKVFVLLGAALLLVASMMLAVTRGTAFMPEMESTQASVTLEAPEGSTFEETSDLADQVTEALLEIKDVKTVGAMSGSGSSGMMGMGKPSATSVSMYLILDEEKELSGVELEKEILERTKDIPCELTVTTSSMDMSALGGAGIQIQVRGKELDTLKKLAKDVAGVLEETEGTKDVSDGMEETTPELDLIVDEEKAAAYNLTTAQIFQLVYAHVSESKAASILSAQNKDYSIYVKDKEQKELTRNGLEEMLVSYTDKNGETKKVALKEFVTITDGVALSSITRDSQQRMLTVSAAIDSDHNIGLVSNEVKSRLEQIHVPEGYRLEMTGEDATIEESMGQVMLMLLLAIIFMYCIMVAQFQSLLSPFIVMFTVPLAFTGGFLGLFLTGNEVSIIGMIGFVMLSGIIVNNGIVLVDYTNQLRAAGYSKREALIEAGRTRMRPVLMTALTTILGLVPMVASTKMGADMMKPMSIVCIGGLLYGTFMTLIVVPCIYDLFRREKSLVEEEIHEIEDTDPAV